MTPFSPVILWNKKVHCEWLRLPATKDISTVLDRDTNPITAYKKSQKVPIGEIA